MMTEALKLDHADQAKRMPKYLEYAYAALLSVSLFQVLVSGDKFRDYIEYTVGSPSTLAAEIQHQATNEFSDNCQNGAKSEYYDAAYCEKLHSMATASNTKDYVLATVVNDTAFLGHVIYHGAVVWSDVPADVKSDVVPLIERLHAVAKYGATSDTLMNGMFGWVTLSLLPISIALRLVKRLWSYSAHYRTEVWRGLAVPAFGFDQAAGPRR